MHLFRHKLASHTLLTATLVLAQGFLCLGARSEPVAYEVTIEGIQLETLQETLTAISETIEKREELPASLLHLRRRAQHDKEQFLRALKSQAYYGGVVVIEIKEDQAPVQLIFHVDPGPLYIIKSVSYAPAADYAGELPELPGPAALGLPDGIAAKARTILDAEKRLENMLRNVGYPHGRVTGRDVLVDHATEDVTVTYEINLGEKADFGVARISGLESVEEQVIARNLPWDAGQLYEKVLMDEAQKELYETELFSTVLVKPGDEVGADGQVPIDISVTERKHRTIGGGLQYRTDEGASARFRWQHRNIQGLGRRLTLDAVAGQTRSELTATYLLNDFRRKGQNLKLSGGGGFVDYEAYSSTFLGAEAWIERELNDNLTLGIGTRFNVTRTEQLDITQTYELLSFPVQVFLDRSNDVLNPTEGFRLKARIEPFADVFDGDTFFLKGDLVFTHYLQLGQTPNWVLASRLGLGGIAGDSLLLIPPSERFYAGGGGSIRGYPFQTVSPLIGNDPIGGRSLLETAVELRHRLSDRVGLVTFVDAGSAFESSWPDFGNDLRLSAGVGVRYFSPVGPLRFDVAVPLNPRKSIDSAFEFYISIGQAF
ncbi:MAG: autotransporter assembly complex protein TamA [Candidatus Hydrogenedentes bacterium]|nr:autotransporter assembly complex protein TamA [Candidatus Hydrogenedentota bacterium]